MVCSTGTSVRLACFLAAAVSAQPLRTVPDLSTVTEGSADPDGVRRFYPPNQSKFSREALWKYLAPSSAGTTPDEIEGFKLDLSHVFLVAFFSNVQLSQGLLGSVGEIGGRG